jgi:hypothetical protein
MKAPGKYLQTSFGIREITLFGCGQNASSTNTIMSSRFQVAQALTPVVGNILPSVGSTAGGTRITLSGSFAATDPSSILVDIGGFGCAIQSVFADSTGGNKSQIIVCLTRASGVKNGGLKYVRLWVPGQGWSRYNSSMVFWYVRHQN